MTAFSFEAVVFDLDGTLVATERYWPDAARTATLRFFGEQGVDRAIPSTADWLAMVGMPLEAAFDDLFADLDPGLRKTLLAECSAEERRLLGRGRAALLSGVTDVLSDLKRRGVRIGVASNCRHDYLDAMMNDLGLRAWVEEARCLATPGMGNKASMIEDLSLTFDTRSLVMVGDRRGDRDSAWANGFPHVHIPRGYGGTRERVEAELTLDAIDQLPQALLERDRVLEDALRMARRTHKREGSIAVTGLPLAGSTLCTRDLVRLGGTGTAHEVGATRADDDAPAIFVTASEDVLVRRAHGKRSGVAPVQQLLETSLPAARQRGIARGALVVDMSNPIAPSFETVS